MQSCFTCFIWLLKCADCIRWSVCDNLKVILLILRNDKNFKLLERLQCQIKIKRQFQAVRRITIVGVMTVLDMCCHQKRWKKRKQMMKRLPLMRQIVTTNEWNGGYVMFVFLWKKKRKLNETSFSLFAASFCWKKCAKNAAVRPLTDHRANGQTVAVAENRWLSRWRRQSD